MTAPVRSDPSRREAMGPRRVTQPLRVAAVEDGRATLLVERQAGCGGCALKTGCAASALGEMLGAKKVPLESPSPSPLSTGDIVQVSMPASAFLTAASLMFLVPPTALVTAMLLSTGLGLSPVWTVLTGAAAFGLAFWPLRLAERRGALAHDIKIEPPTPAREAP